MVLRGEEDGANCPPFRRRRLRGHAVRGKCPRRRKLCEQDKYGRGHQSDPRIRFRSCPADHALSNSQGPRERRSRLTAALSPDYLVSVGPETAGASLSPSTLHMKPQDTIASSCGAGTSGLAPWRRYYGAGSILSPDRHEHPDREASGLLSIARASA